MTATVNPAALQCPVPLEANDRVQLGHGSGGKLSAQLVARHFLPHFENPALAQLGDASIVSVAVGEIAVSTDSSIDNSLVLT